MRTTTLAALLWMCAGVAGCTTSGTEDAGAELGPGAGTLALLRLERFPQTEVAPARVVTNAKVARFTGLDGSSVLKLLGVDVRDGEGCVVSGRLDDFPLAEGARVELLSVGDISLRVGERSHTLSPRLFPDLAATASGWFYAGNADMSAELATAVQTSGDGGLERADEYVLAAQGEQGVGRFELAVAAPGEVQGIALAGETIDGQSSLTRTLDAHVTWEPEDMRDRVELEVFAGSSVLSCSVRDDGHFTLPRSKLSLLEADPQASMVVRRVRVLSTDMQGIEAAYVRIASTRTFVVGLD